MTNMHLYGSTTSGADYFYHTVSNSTYNFTPMGNASSNMNITLSGVKQIIGIDWAKATELKDSHGRTII